MSTSLNNLNDFKSISDYYRINEDKLRNHAQLINFLLGGMRLDDILDQEVVLYGPGQFSRQVNRLLKLIVLKASCFCIPFAPQNLIIK